MYIFPTIFFAAIASAEYIEYYAPNSGLDNPHFCENVNKCVALHRCPEILSMMNELSLPVHRFRQVICGYSGSSPKVCCDFPREFPNPGNENKVSDCGTSLIRSNIHTLGSHPFVARIGFINLNTGAIKYPCSGAIIDERNILTTASCALANSNDYKLFSVLLGDYDSSSDPDCNSLFCGHKARHYNISYVIKHPDYNARNFENNIALIRLKSNVDYSVTIRPICLSKMNNLQHQNTTLIGWGEVANLRDKPSVQQALKMTLLPNQECSRFLNRGFSVELCASGQLEPCSGYSGSPLVQKFDNLVLVGLLSYGASCDEQSRSPSVFTDVYKYSNWIKDNAV